MIETASITQRATSRDDVYAFDIHGEVSAGDMQAMADCMNDAFDAHDKVSMLLAFRDYGGSETFASLDWSSIKSRLRSLVKVDKYVTVGAPDSAGKMIEAMGSVMPVQARSFALSEDAAAWSFVGARPA